MGIGLSSNVDPFTIADIGPSNAPIWKRTNNKTLKPSVLNTSVREIVLLVLGQSQLCNVNPTPYVPTNAAAIKNLNVLDGACYSITGSLLGCTNFNTSDERGNPAARIADLLITNNVCDSVWLITPAVGGTGVEQWNSGNCAVRVNVAVSRLAALGIPASRIDAVIWGQGETDGGNGVSQAAYTASLSNLIARSRSLGVTAPWFVARESWSGTVFYPAIEAAQAAIVNHSLGIWAGADADSIGGASVRFDTLHFNDTAAATYASLWVAAMHAYGAPF